MYKLLVSFSQDLTHQKSWIIFESYSKNKKVDVFWGTVYNNNNNNNNNNNMLKPLLEESMAMTAYLPMPRYSGPITIQQSSWRSLQCTSD